MAKLTRPCIIAGNWKMYKTIDQALAFIDQITPSAEKSSCKVLLAVPYTSIRPASEKAKNTKIVIGAQNMNDATDGAFTGEVAGAMLKEAGAEFVILGHSERRAYFHEDDAFINRKVKRSVACNLQPLLCLGETYEEHQEGRAHEVIKMQLTACLADVDKGAHTQLIVAYEPRWAVGTGLAASTETVSEAHQFIRELLAEMWGTKEAQKVPILYGGSVNLSNAASFLDTAEIDGLLIGAASLRAETFAKIIDLRQNQ